MPNKKTGKVFEYKKDFSRSGQKDYGRWHEKEVNLHLSPDAMSRHFKLKEMAKKKRRDMRLTPAKPAIGQIGHSRDILN